MLQTVITEIASIGHLKHTNLTYQETAALQAPHP